jgi:large repetitive protein
MTIKFFTPGATTPTNVLTASPVYTFNPASAKSGSTAMVQVVGITPGTYDITAVTPTCLLNVRRGEVIALPSTDVNLGELREGNADDNIIINIQDFGILAATYGKSSGATGFDTRADFDRNGIINIADFGLLAANYGRISPIEVP